MMTLKDSEKADIQKVLDYCSDMSLLYVEDDRQLLSEMQEMFEDFFDDVTVAKDGSEGLEKFRSSHEKYGTYPDLVFTDIRMPELNGIEMSKEILLLNPEQIIVVLSAHNESEVLIELINTGISHFLLKPIALKQLYRTLSEVCEKDYYKKKSLQYAKELERLANLDPLTGISNRRHFFNKINRTFPKIKQKNVPLCVCILDLDRFKIINDTYGHSIGDGVIKKFVDIVQSVLSKEDCFARFGGDEFVVCLKSSLSGTLQMTDVIKKKVSEIETIQDQKITFSVSIGVASLEPEDTNIDEVIKRADIDLYNEKRRKHNTSYSE